jgi:dihydroneopterin aldolase
MGKIYLNGMEFYAYHGCFQEEQVAGNQFVVDLEIETDMSVASKSDQIEDALNYTSVYTLVQQEMAIRSHLLEHVSNRILAGLFVRFPQIQRAEVRISKCNPPMGGWLKSVAVSQQKNR